MRLLIIIVMALFAVTPAIGQNIDFLHDGLTRQYRIHIPDGLPAQAPLVLALHGYSGNNNDMMMNYGWVELADERGFVVAFPNGTRDQWNNRFWDVDYDFHQAFDIDDDGFLSALAVHLQGLHGLDPDRTYVTGFSNGAEMCFQLACRESETFMAFAPIVGMMLDSLWNSCDPAIKRPILSLNGTADDVTLYQGDMNNSGGWGAYHSIPDMMAYWADILDTPDIDRTYLEDTNPNDGSTVRLDVYTSPDHDLELWYYLVLGGGHDWPGRWGNMDMDATLEAWTFFDSRTGSCTVSDVTGDGLIDVSDVLTIIGDWGNPYDVGDLLSALERWGDRCAGACCYGGTCAYIDSDQCDDLGGTWNGPGSSCTTVSCPQLGACCWDDGSCEYTLSDNCLNNGGSFRGAGTNCLIVDCSEPGYNDECNDAWPIGDGQTLFTTYDATDSSDGYNDNQCPGSYLGQMHADVWFIYEATCTGVLTVSTCDIVNFDTDLVVYQGDCFNLDQVSCNGDSDNCADFTSYLQFSVVAGQDYLIRVGGWEPGNVGNGSLLIECND
ncbi:MAG: hypothetical protein MK116_07875 [Phycisphaerales bacterium]|nr:hypothetical protein [Phycisphaerales bacterium]